MGPVVGIDLGTTNSLVAYLEDGRPKIAPNQRGARSTPSVVALDAAGRLVVGARAKEELVLAPDRAFAEVKRLMGSAEKVRLADRQYTPTEMSGIVLRALRDDAERFFGDTVEEAIVTVPAYFTDAQRQATKDAGELAGFRVERILNEPTAAALAYGIDHLDAEEHVVVYDLGGGTFDVSVLEMFGGVLDVKATAGDSRLGGGDFDRALAEQLRIEVQRVHGIDVRDDRRAMARLLAAAERAKLVLSTSDVAPIDLPALARVSGRDVTFTTEVTRAQFEALIGEQVASTLSCLDAALSDAKVPRGTVSQVVLVGGSSRVPLVRQRVAEYFGKQPRTDVDPDEAVALGAAIQAGLKTGAISAEAGIMITDVSPFTLGLEAQSKAGRQIVHGVFAPVIPRNSTVPVSRTERFSTTADGQKSVTIKVFQGESRYTKNNVFLDEYTLDGVPAAPAGRESVAVTFTYDINGILDVTTEIVSTGKKATLVIDKSPRRMTDGDRSIAKERVEREWGLGGAGSAAPAVSFATAPAASAPAAAPNGEFVLLVSTARERLGTASGTSRAQLETLLRDADEAITRGDHATIAALDTALTDLLFAMGLSAVLQDKKRAVVVEPRNPEARFALGEALHLEGDHEGAVAQLEKALELDGQHGNARRLLARTYLAQERFTLAEKLLRPAADEEDVDACDALADLYLKMNRADDALLYLDVAARRAPGSLDRHVRAAELALALGLLEKASEHAAVAAQLAPTDRRVRGVASELAQRRGDVSGAIEAPLGRGEAFLLGRALATTSRAMTDLPALIAALRASDLAGARRALVTAPAAVKATAGYAWSRGEVALVTGDHEVAARAFREAAKSPEVEARAAAHRRLGEIAAWLGDHRAARDAYRSAVDTKEDVDGLEGLGDALAKIGEASAAEDAYRRAATLDPASVAAIKLGALRAQRKHGAVSVVSNVGRIGALGWSARGGLVSPVEATCVPGKGEILFTGNVGSIGREAAQVATSCVKARAAQLGIADRVKSTDLHVHFTDMEISKDGASAGLALALAATSAYQDLELLPALAATGQITVNGAIKSVAGLHEKLVAACLAGIRTVLLPRRCILDLDDLPTEVRRRVTLHGVDSLPEAIELAFGLPASTRTHV